MTARGIRKEMVGKVISDKMQKTVMVETQRHVKHPRYKKTIVRRMKFSAHDEKETAHKGDVVRIRECRPLSKTKRWRVVDILRVHPVETVVKAKPKAKAKTTAKKTTTRRRKKTELSAASCPLGTGFRREAQSTGVRIRATTTDSNIAAAMVTEN